MVYIQGYEDCMNDINDVLNGAIAHMDKHKSAESTLDAVNMFISRVHIMNSSLTVMKEAAQKLGGM